MWYTTNMKIEGNTMTVEEWCNKLEDGGITSDEVADLLRDWEDQNEVMSGVIFRNCDPVSADEDDADVIIEIIEEMGG